MEFKKLIWKNSTSKYTSGKDAFIGKIKVGTYYYNGIDRDPALRYVAKTTLPNLKPDLGKFPTEEEAIDIIEKSVAAWLKEITQ